MAGGREKAVKECLIMESSQVGFKIGLQGTIVQGEGARVKFYFSKLFECNTRNTEKCMIGQFRGKFVYRGSLGNVCRTQSNGGAKVSPPIWKPARKKWLKYGIEKRLGGFVFANILKLVIYIA
jgi:hypothetical protein